jgi:signal transduction histidine kinase
MDQLLNDVLTIGQVEGGSLRFNPAPLDLEPFCRDLVEEIQFSAGFTHQIIFNYQGGCYTASLDKRLLRHILINLLSNAIKYSPRGGVDFSLSCLDGEAVFQIKDRGIGIPPEDQRHLFEPFQRAGNVGNIPGTGLGLTMVKKCLDLHCGQIDIESEVGIGTTVTIKLFLASQINSERGSGAYGNK